MENVVRRINGVSPEVADASSVPSFGSENRTRFLQPRLVACRGARDSYQ